MFSWRSTAGTESTMISIFLTMNLPIGFLRTCERKMSVTFFSKLWEIHLRQWRQLFPKKPVAIAEPFEVCFEGDRVITGRSPDGVRKVLGRRVSSKPVQWKEPGR